MKKKEVKPLIPLDKVEEYEDDLLQSLSVDKKYSLEIDPTGELHLTPEQKSFVENYIQFRSVPLASKLAGITEDDGIAYYTSGACRAEIKRLNMVLHCRQFSRRMLNIDEIGGYLTSMLMDEDVVEIDKLKSKDKLKAAELLINLNKLKAESFVKPTYIVDVHETEESLKKMDAKDLQKLISSMSKEKKVSEEEKEKKTALIRKFGVDGYLDPADMAYLETLSIEELTSLLEQGGLEK